MSPRSQKFDVVIFEKMAESAGNPGDVPAVARILGSFLQENGGNSSLGCIFEGKMTMVGEIRGCGRR